MSLRREAALALLHVERGVGFEGVEVVGRLGGRCVLEALLDVRLPRLGERAALLVASRVVAEVPTSLIVEEVVHVVALLDARASVAALRHAPGRGVEFGGGAADFVYVHPAEDGSPVDPVRWEFVGEDDDAPREPEGGLVAGCFVLLTDCETSRPRDHAHHVRRAGELRLDVGQRPLCGRLDDGQ